MRVRRIGLLFIFCVLVGGIAWSVLRGGLLEGVQAFVRDSGLEVKTVMIKGNNRQSLESLEAAVEVVGEGILGVSLKEMARDIKSLPWVRGVVLRKVFPETIEVLVTEHEPMAVMEREEEKSVLMNWQGEFILFLEELAGEERISMGGDRFVLDGVLLPVLRGMGKEKEAVEVLSFCRRVGLYGKVEELVYVQSGRWDMVFDGVTVKLPALGYEEAWTAFLAYDSEGKLLSSARILDLRLFVSSKKLFIMPKGP